MWAEWAVEDERDGVVEDVGGIVLLREVGLIGLP